jgi:YVTN family beta-propeller protein
MSGRARRFSRISVGLLISFLIVILLTPLGAGVTGLPPDAPTKIVANIVVGNQSNNLQFTGVTYDADDGFFIFSNAADSNLTIVNGTTHVVWPPLALEGPAAGITIDPVNGFLYATVYPYGNSSAGSGGYVSVIDRATPTPTNVLTGSSPSGIVYDYEDQQVFVANSGSDNVSIMNTQTNAVVDSLPVGKSPNAVAVDSLEETVFVGNTLSNSVTVINGISDAIMTTIPLGFEPWGIAADTATGNVYVSSDCSDQLAVINGATNTLIGNVSLGDNEPSPSSCPGMPGFPQGVAVDSPLGLVFVTSAYAGDVTIVNTTTDTAVLTVAVGRYPVPVSVDPVNGEVYVAKYASTNISVLGPTATPPPSTTVMGLPATDDFAIAVVVVGAAVLGVIAWRQRPRRPLSSPPAP